MFALPQPLRGIVPPLLTLLLDGDTLDREANIQHAERMIEAGVSGLFLLGTTGEAPGLSYRLRRELVELICSQARGRVPVLVSVTDTSAPESLALAHYAAEQGASGLVLAPPFYYPLSQPELLKHFERLIPQLPLPVYLYNIPSHARTPIAADTVYTLAQLPMVYGVKDSSGDLANLQAYVSIMRDRPDFAVFCGPEEMLGEAIRAGAHGGIAGGSNLFPRLYVKLYLAACAGDSETTEKLQQQVLEISDRIYHAVPGSSSYLRGMKCALHMMGKCKYIMAEPYEPFSQDIQNQIKTAVNDIALAKV